LRERGTTWGCGAALLSCLRCCALAAAVVFAGMSAGAAPAAAQTLQSAKSQRTLEGMVREAGGQPLSGAIVYLKNLNSLAVKTYVTTTDGDFHFGQVGMDSDYEIYAEAGGKKSKTKRISAFNSKKRWTIDLTVAK
jgi:hypothetical protein